MDNKQKKGSKEIFDRVISNAEDKVITEESAKQILTYYGVKVPGYALVTSADEAAR